MCLPVKGRDGIPPAAGNEYTTESSSIGANALSDLHQTRDDVVAEVMKAPKRRIDNVITHLNDSVHLLLMHALVVEETRKKHAKMVWEQRLQTGSTMFAGLGLSGLGAYFGVPMPFTGGLLAATILSVGGMS